MKLVEFKKTSGKCKVIVESARIQHAEDLILFQGHQGALKAIDMLKNIAGGKQGVSIKWDGSPAVVFGFNPNNEFIFFKSLSTQITLLPRSAKHTPLTKPT